MQLFTRSVLSAIFFSFVSLPVWAQLTAGFTVTPVAGCQPLVVSFTNTTAPGSGTTYSWDLGNGSGPDTLTNPSTSYIGAGTYTVTLTATHGTLTSTSSQVITVYPSPVVNFTVSDTLICPGAPDNFTTTTVAGVAGTVTYLWSYGDGYTSTSASGIHAYSFPGYFNITLNATNADGCSSSLTKSALVHVRTPPVPDFVAANTHICNPPVDAVFSNEVTGAGPFTYKWAFGDGSPASYQPDPAHLYSALGSYNVQLVATDVHGCEDSNTVSGYINVLYLVASFTAPDSVCVNLPVIFTNTSSPYLTRMWLYGDGASDSNVIGKQTYTAGGIDTVKMITYNGYCYDTAAHPIYVQAPAPAFTVTPVHPCPAPETSVFTASVIPNSTVQWHFGDSLSGSGSTVSHTYTADEINNVQMIATTDIGCKDTVNQTYTIYDISYVIQAPAYSPLNSCVPSTIRFSLFNGWTLVNPFTSGLPYPYSITSYTWNFDDGSPVSHLAAPSHTFTAVGYYIVSLTFTTGNGCTFTTTDSVVAGVAPIVTFTATPLRSCQDTNEITFTSHTIFGNPQVYWWLFGEGTYNPDEPDTNSIVSHHFLLPGLFSDTLIAYYFGCPDTFIRHDYVKIDSPNALVYPTIDCIPANKVIFGDSSKGDDTRIWFFGDGTTDTSRNPVHIYASPLLYNVMFTDYNTLSTCRDTEKITLNLTKPVIAFSTPDSAICRDEYVIINSSVISGLADYYDWFADGISDDYNNFNFIDTFHTTGYYTVLLVVHDQNNCPDTTKRVNYILVAKPVASFTASPPTVCYPSGATFTDVSTDVSGVFLSNFKWSFGDSTIATTVAPSIIHYYTTIGTYTTKEIVTDNLGCMDSLTQTLVSVYHPYSFFTAGITSSCAFIPIPFTNYFTPGLSFYWNFGDGTSSTLNNPAHAYTDSGTFTVTLVVTDPHGCTDTFTRTNYIKISKPYASFSVSDTVGFCPPFVVPFSNTSTGAASNKWIFGDGDSSVATNPTNIYTSPGYNTVELIVTNSSGCRDTAFSHVKIYGYAGAFSYNIDSGCVPLVVTFNANLNNVAGLSNITWDFFDGTTLTGSLSDSVITHTYMVPGSFLPRLILIAAGGCKDTSVGLLPVNADAVTPGFTSSPNPVCLGDTLLLADTSHSYWSHISGWNWSYNGTSATSQTAIAVFNSVGTDSVNLTITDAWTCHASTFRIDTVISIPGIAISPDSVTCTGNTIHLIDPAPGGVWSTSNAAIAIVGAGTGVVTGISGGAAIITYRLSDGCHALADISVIAYPDPGFITGNPGVCVGDTIILTDTAAGGTWNVGNGNATVSPAGIITGITAGTDTISYTVANGMCDTSAIKIITVYPLPYPGIITGQNPVCIGAVISLADSTPGGHWSSGNSSVATVDSAGNVKATSLGTAVITYTTAPSPNGCTNVTTFPLNVINTDFSTSSAVNQVKCYNDSDANIAVKVIGGNPPFQFQWSTKSTDTFITNLDTGTYILSITEPVTQCILDDTFLITQPDTLSITADIKEDICRGSKGSIITTVAGGTAPYTYAWSDKQSGSSISDLLTGTYELSLTDNNGCTKTMTFTVPDTCDEIIIYDAISPNGDGINDTWVILGLQLFPTNTVQLFDKWGDEVFSATNYKNDFAGKGKKGELPDGTYYYLVKLNSPNPPDGRDSYTGSLLIKR